MSMLQISRVLSWLQPVIGLLIMIAGTMLIRRSADPAVKLLTTWGGFWLLTGLWASYTEAVVLHATAISQIPAWFNTVSGVCVIGGRLLLYGTALYALWRFWNGAADAKKVG